MNQESIAIPANDLGFEAGQLVKSEDGKIFQIGLDEKGNRTLVNTGIDPNLQNVSMGGNEDFFYKAASDSMDLSSRYQAIHNYDEKSGTTVINGIEFKFVNNSYNYNYEVVAVEGRLWTNLTNAAGSADIDKIYVYALDYGKSEPHAAGLAADISMVNSNGNDIVYKREYVNGEYNKPVADTAITNFENSLKDQPGTKNVWSPWTTFSENAWNGPNMIDQYPGVHDTGKVGLEQSTKFKKYADEQGLTQDETNQLYRGYQHPDHLHYQIEKPKPFYIPKELEI